MNLTEVHNRDAEEMLVSAGFRAEGTLQRQIVSEVSAESLYSETCRNAWRMLVDLLSEGVDLFDPTAFITAAQRFDRWRELVSVTTKNPSALNWRHYHKIVTGHAAVRKQAAVYLNGLRRLTDSVQVESEEDPTSIASDSATALHSLLTGGARTTSVNQRQAMRKVLDRLQANFEGELLDLEEEEPEKVNDDPYGDGWMIKIKVADTAVLETLLSADDYKAIIGA